MDIKKLLTVGAGAALLSLGAACSDPEPNNNPVGPGTSSGVVSGGGSSDSKGGDVTSDDATYVSVTEIMYNAPATINGVEASELEWVELSIVKGEDIRSMSFDSLHLDGAVSYTLPNEPLKVGEYIVVTNNVELFKQVYPDPSIRVYGPWTDPKTGNVGKLVNEGDVIDVKIKGKGDMSCSYSSEPPWTSLADGKGRTLVYLGGNPAQASAWAASVAQGGNPGSGDDPYVKPSAVRINEIQPFVLGTDAGWIELYNSGSEPVDVSGWILKSKIQGKEWPISAGVVPAKGFLVLDPSDAATFGSVVYFNAKGGEYYLYEVVGGEKTGSESSLKLAASNLSSGIVEVSDGSISQGAMITATPGAANSALKSGPIFINEIYYHPPEGGEIPFEYLELVNMSDTPVSLAVTKGTTSKGWKIEGVNMEFKGTDIVPANGMMLVIPTAYAVQESEIRAKHGIPETVPFAFYQGKLSNRGELIAVKQPFDFDTNEKTKEVQWYYDWSDAVLYSDSWDGFKQTDGYGKSMHRSNFDSMGYEASSWIVGDPTPGK